MIDGRDWSNWLRPKAPLLPRTYSRKKKTTGWKDALSSVTADSVYAFLWRGFALPGKRGRLLPGTGPQAAAQAGQQVVSRGPGCGYRSPDEYETSLRSDQHIQGDPSKRNKLNHQDETSKEDE